jgi:hypothetical protein
MDSSCCCPHSLAGATRAIVPVGQHLPAWTSWLAQKSVNPGPRTLIVFWALVAMATGCQCLYEVKMLI